MNQIIPGISEIQLVSFIFNAISIVFVFGIVFGFFRVALFWILPKEKRSKEK